MGNAVGRSVLITLLYSTYRWRANDQLSPNSFQHHRFSPLYKCRHTLSITDYFKLQKIIIKEEEKTHIWLGGLDLSKVSFDFFGESAESDELKRKWILALFFTVHWHRSRIFLLNVLLLANTERSFQVAKVACVKATYSIVLFYMNPSFFFFLLLWPGKQVKHDAANWETIMLTIRVKWRYIHFLECPTIDFLVVYSLSPSFLAACQL